jgi:SAM-dependent methyltransferase
MARQLEAVGRCPVCGGTRFAPYLRAGDWNLWRCAACSLVLLRPRPPAAFYDGIDRLEALLDPGVLARADAEVEANAGRVAQLERFVSPGALFDVGAGPGFFMKAAERRGWRVMGCDPVPECVAFGRGRLGLGHFWQGTFAAVQPQVPRGLDAVVLFHSLEHMVDPLGALRGAWELLRVGGVVCLEVPNILSPQARRDGPRWEHLRLPYHAHFLTPRSASELLARSGFRLLHVGPLHDWFLQVLGCKAAA